MKPITAAIVLCLCALSSARAAQFHVPLHMPPHTAFSGEAAEKSLYLEVGAALFKAGGVDVSGPGGCLELSAAGKGALGASVRACGFSLSGKVDPLRLGRTGGGGFAGALEADIFVAPRGRGGLKFYAGGLAGVSVLDIRDPLSYTVSGGKLVVEPDSAFSIFVGVPVGAELPLLRSEGWNCALQADVLLLPGGVTFFTYLGLPGSDLYGSSSSIDPSVAGGTRLSFYYKPWRLLTEAGLRVYSGSGANDAASAASLLLGVKF